MVAPLIAGGARLLGGALATQAIDSITNKVADMMRDGNRTATNLMMELGREQLESFLDQRCFPQIPTPPTFPGGQCGGGVIFPSPTPPVTPPPGAQPPPPPPAAETPPPATQPGTDPVTPPETQPPVGSTNGNITIDNRGGVYIDIDINVNEQYNQSIGRPNGNELGASVDEVVNRIAEQMPPMDAGNFRRVMDQLREEVEKMFKQVLEQFRGSGTDNPEGENTTSNMSGAPRATTGSQDFFTALATAVGELMQKSADEVFRLSGEVSNAYAQSASANKENAHQSTGTNQPTTTNNTGTEDADKAKLMMLQTEMSAATMRMNFMTTGLQSSLKAVADSLNSLART